MIKDGGLSFEIQLKIEFLPPINGSKKCLEKSLIMDENQKHTSGIYPSNFNVW